MLLGFRIAYHRTGESGWLQTYKLWTKIFALTFAMGVVTGIVMSFQFGTNWPGYMNRVGAIAGPLLATRSSPRSSSRHVPGRDALRMNRVPRGRTSAPRRWSRAARPSRHSGSRAQFLDARPGGPRARRQPVDRGRLDRGDLQPPRSVPLHAHADRLRAHASFVVGGSARGGSSRRRPTQWRDARCAWVSSPRPCSRRCRPWSATSRAEHPGTPAGPDRGDGGDLAHGDGRPAGALRDSERGGRGPTTTPSRSRTARASSSSTTRTRTPGARVVTARTTRRWRPCSSPSASWWASAS